MKSNNSEVNKFRCRLYMEGCKTKRADTEYHFVNEDSNIILCCSAPITELVNTATWKNIRNKWLINLPQFPCQQWSYSLWLQKNGEREMLTPKISQITEGNERDATIINFFTKQWCIKKKVNIQKISKMMYLTNS